MLRTTLILLLVLVVPAAAMPISFYSPAELGGDASLHGEYALILQVPARGSLAGAVSLDAFEMTNDTHTDIVGENAVLNMTEYSALPFVPQFSSHGPLEADFSGRLGQPGRIYLQAASIEVIAKESSGYLVGRREGLGLAHQLLPQVADPYWDRPLDAGGQWVGSTGDFQIRAAGITFLGWAGLTVACKSAPCPTGGGFWHMAQGPPAASWTVKGFSIEDMITTGGSITLNGTLGVIGVGTTGVELTGWSRLPLADSHMECAYCPANQTLWSSGSISLANLTYVDSQKLRTDFDGNLTGARLDELTVPATAFAGPVIATTATVAGAAVGALALRLLWGVLVTKRVEEPLLHPRRQALYGIVVATPGITFRALVRETGIAVGTTAHHMAILKRAGLVMERRHRATRRFFENHGRFEHDWNWVVALKAPEFKLLFEEVQMEGAAPQKVILDRMAVHGWSRSTTQHRLDRLAEQGVLAVRLQGRYKIYTPQVRPAGKPAFPAPPGFVARP